VHSRGSTACASPIAGETCRKAAPPAPRGELRLAPDSSYSAATIRRTVSTTMSRARSPRPREHPMCREGRVMNGTRISLRTLVHHEIVEVNGIFGHRREKQSGRHETSLISRYWKPAAITRPRYADISALVRLLVRSARQAKIGELLKIERHRGSTAGRNRPADFNPTSIGCPADIIGTHADGRGGARRGRTPDSWHSADGGGLTIAATRHWPR